MTTDTEEFLAHFGVKGMRWGVTHDLDTTGHIQAGPEEKAKLVAVKRNAKAGKFDELAKGYDADIKAIQARTPTNAFGRAAQRNDLADTTKLRDRALHDADLKRQGKLSTNQKRVAIGAAIVGAVIVGAVVKTNVQNGEFNRLALKGKALLNGQKDLPFKKKPEWASSNLSPRLVHAGIVDGINPKYGSPGTKVNCRRATFAYEMRRRGYNVSATRTTGHTQQNAQSLLNATTPGKFKSTNSKAVFLGLFKESVANQKDSSAPTPLRDLNRNNGLTAVLKTQKGTKSFVESKSIFDSLAREPSGSRGELSVQWLGGGGHSMAYEIFNGKPVVFDAQNGKMFDSLEALSKGVGSVASAGHTRLDNIELNTNYLGRWLKNGK